jgi:hypothetical protein
VLSDDPQAPLAAGERMPRRAFLRMAAGATVGLPLALAGCGEKTPVAAFRADYAILDAASSPPDIGRLLKQRAREQHVAPTLTSTCIVLGRFRAGGGRVCRSRGRCVPGARGVRAALVVGAFVSSAAIAACGGGDGGSTPSAGGSPSATAPATTVAQQASGGSRSPGDVCSLVTSGDVAHAFRVAHAPAGRRTGPGPRADCVYALGSRVLTVQPQELLNPTTAKPQRQALLRDRSPGAKLLSIAGFVVRAKPIGPQRPRQWAVSVVMIKGNGLRALSLSDASAGPTSKTSALMNGAVRLAKSAARRARAAGRRP